MLAAIACFAIERGLVVPDDTITRVRLFDLNTHPLVPACVPTANRHLTYEGGTRIHGVPGTGAGIAFDFTIRPARVQVPRSRPATQSNRSMACPCL
jgi:2-methylaconitate cis-trans-isomerase PrpF